MTRAWHVLLFLFGVAALALASYYLKEEAWPSVPPPPPERRADVLARSALKVAENPAEGWFPVLKQPIYSWETDEEGWKLDTGELAVPTSLVLNAAEQGEDPGARQPHGLRIASERHTHGAHSLAVPVNFPNPTALFCPASTMHGVRFIAYDVFVPREARGYIGCLFFLKDKDGLWFQARSRTALTPGRWTTVTADLRGGSPDVEPLGHLGQWDENQATQVTSVGLTFYGDQPFRGEVFLDQFRGWARPDRFKRLMAQPPPDLPPERRKELEELRTTYAESYQPEPLLILNLRMYPLSASSGEPPSVRACETLTLSFELNHQVLNPFDTDQADIQAEVRTPAGKTFVVNAFQYQEYERQIRFENEEPAPVGRPEWRVRITPREAGEYSVKLRAMLNLRGLGKEPARERLTAESPALPFVVTPAAARGFIRVSRKDPHFFEFENGEFFYPVGHNVHSPVDLRCWELVFRKEPPSPRGLSMYEDFFPKMKAAGENTAEIWMSSWWLGIEWTRKWRTYHGKGRYSLENAWRLDRLFELAQQYGIQVHLVIDNHGKFSEWCDKEWDLNPYNKECERTDGLVTSPLEFFRSEACRKWHRDRLRYIVARWGHETNLMGFELVSEFDLIGDEAYKREFYHQPLAREWTREMMTAIRNFDPYDHLVTNHYATDYHIVDRSLSDTPLFDYIVGDAYREDAGFTRMAQATDMAFANAGKPFWITEYGGNWNATSAGRLEADLHCGLWSSWLTQAAGTPLFWWYDFVDRRKLYFHYRALASFIAGEDRRGLAGATSTPELLRQPGGIAAVEYRWPEGAYAWVYDTESMEDMPRPRARRKVEGVTIQFSGLAEGRYRIEFWDTYAGKRLSALEADVPNGAPLSFNLPPFESDLALKVKRAPPAAPEPPAVPPAVPGPAAVGPRTGE